MSDTCPNCKEGTKWLGKATYKRFEVVVGVDDSYQCPRCYWGVAIPRNYVED